MSRILVAEDDPMVRRMIAKDLGATKFLPEPLNMDMLREDVVHCLELRVAGAA